MIYDYEILQELKEKYDEVMDRYCKQDYAGKQLLHIMGKDYDKLSEGWYAKSDYQRQKLIDRIVCTYNVLRRPNEEYLSWEVREWANAQRKKSKLRLKEEEENE